MSSPNLGRTWRGLLAGWLLASGPGFAAQLASPDAPGTRAKPVQVSIEIVAAVALEEPLELAFYVAAFRESGEKRVEAHTVWLPTSLTFHSVEGRRRDYWVRGEGWWSARLSVTMTHAPRALTLVAYPTGELVGRLPPGMDPAPEVAARFVQTSGSGAAYPVPASREPCAVELAAFRCVLPATVLDLEIEIGQAQVVRLPATVIERGKTREAGPLAP